MVDEWWWGSRRVCCFPRDPSARNVITLSGPVLFSIEVRRDPTGCESMRNYVGRAGGSIPHFFRCATLVATCTPPLTISRHHASSQLQSVESTNITDTRTWRHSLLCMQAASPLPPPSPSPSPMDQYDGPTSHVLLPTSRPLLALHTVLSAPLAVRLGPLRPLGR